MNSSDARRRRSAGDLVLQPGLNQRLRLTATRIFESGIVLVSYTTHLTNDPVSPRQQI